MNEQPQISDSSRCRQPQDLKPESSTLTPEQEALIMSIIGNVSILMAAQSEVMRERGVRERCYKQWVDQGKLSLLDATERFNRIVNAETILKKVLDLLPKADDTPF